MTIDIHAHIVDKRYIEELKWTLKLEIEQTAEGRRCSGTTATHAWSAADMFDIEHRLREMDKKGIDMRVLR